MRQLNIYENNKDDHNHNDTQNKNHQNQKKIIEEENTVEYEFQQIPSHQHNNELITSVDNPNEYVGKKITLMDSPLIIMVIRKWKKLFQKNKCAFLQRFFFFVFFLYFLEQNFFVFPLLFIAKFLCFFFIF